MKKLSKVFWARIDFIIAYALTVGIIFMCEQLLGIRWGWNVIIGQAGLTFIFTFLFSATRSNNEDQ